MVGAGAVVTKPVSDYEMVYGNPARHEGWVSMEGVELEFKDGLAKSGGKVYRLANEQVTMEDEI